MAHETMVQEGRFSRPSDSIAQLDGMAHRLTQLEQKLSAYGVTRNEERVEKSRLMDLLRFHQRSLLEWLAPEGADLAEQDPSLFTIWREEAQWFIERLESVLAQAQ